MPQVPPNEKREIERRRTFAIISHPDAGKTTLTEKILYQGGVIHEAGEVKGKAGTKGATSDWMELERQKGISITSSVMTFDYHDRRVNLLDTPGHKDFSEDTYRVLMAVDSACMLIDVAKGVEERTRKLYEVCRYRKIPIFTFVNKLDREGKSPLSLIDEIESTLQMPCHPVMWPLGRGERFKGIYHRFLKKFIFWNSELAEIACENPLDENFWRSLPERMVHPEVEAEFREEFELMQGVLPEFSIEEFLAGKLSPVFFGSAKSDFAVDQFLNSFVELAPPPAARTTKKGDTIDPLQQGFSGFVFKIQANMDRRHRDRIAYVRICSGKFERGMKAQHSRLGKELRLAYSSQFLASSRETLDFAYAGDILGINDSGNFAIGDSISDPQSLSFEDIPKFAPELFARLTVRDAMKRKKLNEALEHFYEEGFIQLFSDPTHGPQEPIVGAIGELQFEVLLHRLEDEYNLETTLHRLPLSVARWPKSQATGESLETLKGGFTIYRDRTGSPVILLAQAWDLNWAERENPDVEFASSIAFGAKPR